jgi:hypothetical protein
MEMSSIRRRMTEYWPKAWPKVRSFVQRHLEQTGRNMAAELADKVAQFARGGTAR